MTEGPILSRLTKFLIPFLVINLTQILFNAVDATILGNFAGDDSVAAVGSTAVILYILTALAGGLSSGVNILVARAVGAKDLDRARQTTGTALITALVGSLGTAAVVIPLVPTILTWMHCDPLVMDIATLYLRILLCSIPFQWVYNFLAAAIRASGNSSRTMVIMLIAGACKVGFNFIFVGLLGMDVVGAALSTILTQLIASSLALCTVIRHRSAPYALERQNLRLRKNILLGMVRFGVPTSLSSTSLYFASAIIQSAVNSMGKTAMTAIAVSSQWDAIVYTVGNAVASANMAFVSQNIGARKFDRVKKVMCISVILAVSLSLSFGTAVAALSDRLCGLITDSPEVIELAKERLLLFCFFYFISSIAEVVSHSLISMGHTRNHLFTTLTLGFAFRILWVKAIWPAFGTLRALYAVIPVSTAMCLIEYFIVLFFALPKLKKRLEGDGTLAAEGAKTK